MDKLKLQAMCIYHTCEHDATKSNVLLEQGDLSTVTVTDVSQVEKHLEQDSSH